MPTYEFKNTETGEIVELSLSISDREDYLKDNPHMTQIMSASGLIRGTNYGSKMDAGWKENLSRIAEAHPQSALADRVGGKSAQRSKVEQTAKKHKLLAQNRNTKDTGAGRV